MVSPLDLKSAYHEVVHGGIDDLVTELRQADSLVDCLKRDKVNSVFKNNSLWVDQKPKSGHCEYKHAVTNLTVGWQNHSGKKKSSYIAAAQAKDLLQVLQQHMNILGNDIFGYKIGNWKTQPDYNAAANNYTNSKKLVAKSA